MMAHAASDGSDWNGSHRTGEPHGPLGEREIQIGHGMPDRLSTTEPPARHPAGEQKGVEPGASSRPGAYSPGSASSAGKATVIVRSSLPRTTTTSSVEPGVTPSSAS